MLISCCREERGGLADFSEKKDRFYFTKLFIENMTFDSGGKSKVFSRQIEVQSDLILPEMHPCH